MSLDLFNSERITPHQLEIRGRFMEDQGYIGISMVGNAGDIIAEVWISRANISDVIDWLEFARGRLEEMGYE